MAKELEDEKIIELYWQRDENAISKTDQKYGAYCQSIANNILQNKEDSEECVNDTWRKAWESIPPQKPVNFRMYLAKIVRNLAFNRFNANRAKKRGGGEMVLVLEELSECIADKTDVEQELIGKELKEYILGFIKELPERDRNIFVRRYFYVDPVKSIAKRYGVSENYVMVILSRIRKLLKCSLKKEGFIYE